MDGADILDAGSGFGQYSYYLSTQNNNWTIRGVDVKDEQIADCNRFFKQIGKNNVSFAFGDLTKFQEPNRYDLALSVDVMEHILKMVFKNIHASLKPGGMILIRTPSDQGGSDVHDHDHESFIDEHVRDGYNINEIQEKLKTAGFAKTEAKYSYGSPGKISWRLSMKYPILMLNYKLFLELFFPFIISLLFLFHCC
ncbi:MAG: class I SAM-dependent methyltransferase [Bacteroidales bacterium]